MRHMAQPHSGGAPMAEIQWEDFQRVELRVGTVERVEPFPEARKPAYQLWVNFGEELGTRKSSAQITDIYSPGMRPRSRPPSTAYTIWMSAAVNASPTK